MYRYEEFNDWYCSQGVGSTSSVIQLEAVFMATRKILEMVEQDKKNGVCPLDTDEDFELLFDLMAMTGDLTLSLTNGKKISDIEAAEARVCMTAARELKQ